MPRSPIVIRCLADFVDLPDSELARCLDAFRLAVLREKSRRETLSHAPSSGDFGFDEFKWIPRVEKDPWEAEFTRETPIQALPIRYKAIGQLKDLNIYCLEDLSEISASELSVIPGMGLTTATRLGEVLQRIGLAFKCNPNPVAAMYERSHALRQQKRSSTEIPINADSHASELGLRGQTLSQLLRKGYTTVGVLQSLSLKQYSIVFGRKTALEIIMRLAEFGAPIGEDCSPRALWKHGLLATNEVPFDVSGGDPITHAAPWLGSSLTHKLLESGLSTVAQVVQAAVDGRLGSQGKLTPRARQITINFLRARQFL